MGKKATETDPSAVRCVCLTCGNIFYEFPYRIREGRGKYCSKKCKREGMFGEKNFHWKEPENAVCQQCGKNFEVKLKPSEKTCSRNRGIYCSIECRRKAQSVKISGKNHVRWVEPETRVCKICGIEFPYKPSDMKDARGGGSYCSPSCRGVGIAKRNIESNCGFSGGTTGGSDHWNWKGGISFEPYCPLFNGEFKERVREFWGRRCMMCGEPEYKHEKLAVHHVTYDKSVCCNGAPPLFVSLHRKCNTRANNDRGYWQQYFMELIYLTTGGKCYFTREEMENRLR